MSPPQRIVRIRRQYNQWVADQTLEDYALRFTAKSARRWSSFRVANTAMGAISFLACEAIGSTITLAYGFTNAMAATIAVGLLIFATGLPIAYYAVKHGVDIDLLTRGAGFGYIGSTVTSLIYASFTFIFFAIEAAIMSMALKMCFGVPLPIGYLASSLVIIPIVTHGIKLIGWLQMWTQPVWILLQFLPLTVIAIGSWHSLGRWAEFPGVAPGVAGSFDLMMFGAAGSVVLSLVAQIGEQVDFLRFMPAAKPGHRLGWWMALATSGPGWILLGAVKIAAGSFLAVLALDHHLSETQATEPTELYRLAFRYVTASPFGSLLLVGVFVILSQMKINVANSYAGSLAWSNFFSRLTHSHPGRIVWLVFNVVLALILMELGIFAAIDRILGLYSNFAVAWIGALVADLVVNKPLKLSPSFTEFRRAHLYDFNPVGIGAMAISLAVSMTAFFGGLGGTARALAPFLGLLVAFLAAPVIAFATKGKYYIARMPTQTWGGRDEVQCCICTHKFEPEDMSYCPAYAGPICSLCCTLDARCHDSCKDAGRFIDQVLAFLRTTLPKRLVDSVNARLGHFVGLLALFVVVIGITVMLIEFQYGQSTALVRDAVGGAMSTTFFALVMISGVIAWLFVLAQESRHVSEEESARQTTMLMHEIDAHKLSDTQLQKAKETAESANLAKSRYMLGISHELRAPLNAIFGYAQLLERAASVSPDHLDAVRVIRRSSQHLAYLIDGLLDIAKIEAGRLQLYRDEVWIGEFLDQIVDMFRLQAEAKGIGFFYVGPDDLPPVVYCDENRLRQVLINLLSNAIKYTELGHALLRVRYRGQIAEFDVEDTGIGIPEGDLGRIFEPFERGSLPLSQATPGTGLGLTITKLLTEIMGGEILVESELGKGSLFRVKLYLSEVSNVQPSPPAEDEIRGYRGRRLKILVVDDDQAQIDMMYELLTPLGFVMFNVRDGLSSLDVVTECQPDLVLLDITMPGLNGWEVARRLRMAGHDDLAILMVSANTSEYLAGGNRQGPHDDFLLKPIEIRKLLERMRVLLRIEWIREAGGPRSPLLRIARPRAIPMPGADDSSLQTRLRAPARPHLDALVALGHMGHVAAIEAKLDEIEAEDATAIELVTILRSLVCNFQMKRYMAILQDLGDADARGADA